MNRSGILANNSPMSSLTQMETESFSKIGPVSKLPSVRWAHKPNSLSPLQIEGHKHYEYDVQYFFLFTFLSGNQ
jgi:hypothetical protein